MFTILPSVRTTDKEVRFGVEESSMPSSNFISVGFALFSAPETLHLLVLMVYQIYVTDLQVSETEQ